MPYYDHPHHHPHLGPVDWHEFDPHPYGDPYLIGGRRYVDPDFVANESDDQLPSISTIGRGPRGEGLYVGSTVNQDGTISFTLNSTLTGEVVWESPNLAPAEILFNTVDWRDLVPGVHAPLDITVKRGGVTKTTTAYLPAGQVGSIVFLLGDTLTRTADDTYSVTIADLTVYGRNEYRNKPIPRPNDIVMFHYQDNNGHGLALGTVEAVGGTTRETYHGGDIPTPTNVVFTARTFIPVNNLTGSLVFYGEMKSARIQSGKTIYKIESNGFNDSALVNGTRLDVFFEHAGSAINAALSVNDSDPVDVTSSGLPEWNDYSTVSFVYRNGQWWTNA